MYNQLNSCSTQLRMKFISHINVEIITIVSILTFISKIKAISEYFKQEKKRVILQYFTSMNSWNFMLS